MPVNSSEEILNKLAKKSFLSLWSYSNPYVDKSSKDGKIELTDLLVVFGNHILIFSVKDHKFKDTGDIEKDWKRWKNKAITKSIKQVRGAERFISKYPDSIFIDKRCQQKIYAPIPDSQKIQFHSIIVANGAREACEKYHKQSGSLIICSDKEKVDYPFMVEQPSDGGRFVHILDELTLDVVMRELDTISDFVLYLTKKEKLVEKGIIFNATGEEELLAFYLQDVGSDGKHDFKLPKDCNVFSVDEGHWSRFQNSQARKSRIEADKSSYAWDCIIEKFNYHAINDSLHFSPDGGLKEHELAIRFAAAEPRTRRRFISQSIFELLRKYPPDKRATRILFDDKGEFPTYVILLLPSLGSHNYEQNRNIRINLLSICCRCVPLVYPKATDIVGFATETNCVVEDKRSEDFLYYDARDISEVELDEAKNLQIKHDLFTNTEFLKTTTVEYPSQPSKQTRRNRQKRQRKKNKYR